MATVRLTDAFIPEVYGSYGTVDLPESNAFVASGVISRNSTMDEIARSGGKLPVIPFWNDIDPDDEPNYSNDDPDDEATPDKIDSGTMTGRKAWLNKGFSEMDLVPELAGSSPMQRIRSRFETYWQRQLNRRAIATAVGILADNIANDSGDMVVDISAEAGDAAIFTSEAFIDAAFTLGENVGRLTAIAVHSLIHATLVKNDEIVMIKDSEGNLTIPTYKGRIIITDDQLPVTGSGADRVFTSILFGANAIGFGGVEGSAFAVGEGVPKVPFETVRNPRAGAGGGMEEIWERRTWLLHPFGFEWVEAGAALTEFSPTLADLRLAAHWNRVVPRKTIPMAFIKSKAKIAA